MKKHFAQLIRPWIAELVTRKLISDQIFKYRILDCLSAWENGDGIHTK
jgi:hypothetical protein